MYTVRNTGPEKVCRISELSDQELHCLPLLDFSNFKDVLISVHNIFRGVVAVDVKLEHLDINQCPTEDQNSNVFSNTAKCHYKTQYVSTQ